MSLLGGAIAAVVSLTVLARYVAIPLARGRVLVIRGLVTAGCAVPPAVVWVMMARSLTALSALALVLAASVVTTAWWLLLGIGREGAVERIRFVLEGVGLAEAEAEAEAEDPPTRIADTRGIVSVDLRGPEGGPLVLRLKAAHGIKKAALFRRNVLKFLAATARTEGKS